jgi:hypothetical protein
LALRVVRYFIPTFPTPRQGCWEPGGCWGDSVRLELVTAHCSPPDSCLAKAWSRHMGRAFKRCVALLHFLPPKEKRTGGLGGALARPNEIPVTLPRWATPKSVSG